MRSAGRRRSGALMCLLVAALSLSGVAVAGARAKRRHHPVARALRVPRGNVAVTPARVPLAYNSPTIAVDPADPTHLAIAYYEASQAKDCLLALSTNSGRTWRRRVLVGPRGAIGLASGTTGCVYPSIAYGPKHLLYYAYQLQESAGSQSREVWVTAARHGGARFGKPVRLSTLADSIVHAQVAIAIDRASGRVYVGWAQYTNTTTFTLRNMVASSTNDARTFSAARPLNPVQETFPDEPVLAVGTDGRVYASWRNSDFGPPPNYAVVLDVLEVARSVNHGATFSRPVVANDNFDPGCGFHNCLRPVEYAADNVSHDMAAGTKRGQLYLVDYGLEGGGPTNQTGSGPLGNPSPRRIFFSSSSNGGRVWSKPRIVGIPPGNGNTDQARPAITVTPQGVIWIVYQDMPTADGPGVQRIFEIHSNDGGRTFSVPKQLNSAPSSIGIGPASFSTFSGGHTANLGARLGIASTANDVFFAWTDTRRGTPVSGKQDIYLRALPATGAKP